MMRFPTLQGIAGMSVSLNMYSFKIRLCVHPQKKKIKKKIMATNERQLLDVYLLTLC